MNGADTHLHYFKNADALLADGAPHRRAALEIAGAGLAAADPYVRTHKTVRAEGGQMIVEDTAYALNGSRRIFVVGGGKASFPIAKALEEILGNRITGGVVSVKHGQEGSLRRCRMMPAAHPFPDEGSHQAGLAAADLVRGAREGDIIISCVTGGSSALLTVPPPGVSMADKAETHCALLTCGANIIEINSVRKHVSLIKGGRLARMAPPGAALINLTVSDVIGDALDYITDNTVPDTSSTTDAHAVLDKYKLWDRLPASVTAHLRSGGESVETMREDDLAHISRQDVILAPADAACRGAQTAAEAMGLNSVILSTELEGESAEAGRTFADAVKKILRGKGPAQKPCAVIAGGETTVLIAPGAPGGEGGPNQEFALAAAVEIEGLEGVTVLGIDTDGTDGPTDAAGGLADGGTAARARAAGHADLNAVLAAHDVTPVLRAAGDLVMTGHTGTNVNDLKLIVIMQRV